MADKTSVIISTFSTGNFAVELAEFTRGLFRLYVLQLKHNLLKTNTSNANVKNMVADINLWAYIDK